MFDTQQETNVEAEQCTQTPPEPVLILQFLFYMKDLQYIPQHAEVFVVLFVLG